MKPAGNKKPPALIIGATGQDGYFLARSLLKDGYSVVGVASTPSQDSLGGLQSDIEFIEANIADNRAVEEVLKRFLPSEIYNLAGVTSLSYAWKDPIGTIELNGTAVAKLLESIRRVSPKSRLFQASSAQIFGRPQQLPQDESTPISPNNPYGAAKAMADAAIRSYRERFGIYAVSGILFNHESERRRPEFITRKVSSAVARIKTGVERELVLGDLNATRDWGFAGDFVEAMRLMLGNDTPEDYIIATGEERSVRELVQTAFEYAGLNWEEYVRTEPPQGREGEAARYVGDPSRIKRKLGWKPQTAFKEMIGRMIDHDLAEARG